MIIEFAFLKFDITSDKVGLLGVNGQTPNALSDVRYFAFAEVSVAGEDKPRRYARKGIIISRKRRFRKGGSVWNTALRPCNYTARGGGFVR